MNAHASPWRRPRTPQHAPVSLGHYFGPDLTCDFCGRDWWDLRAEPRSCDPTSEEAKERQLTHRGYKRRARDAAVQEDHAINYAIARANYDRDGAEDGDPSNPLRTGESP